MKSRWVWLGIFLFTAAAAGAVLWMRGRGAAGGSKPEAGPTVPGAVPVAVARATRGNMPVYYYGLGSVTPYYTVTVRTRVDGQLMSVYYREGQFVNSGDLLAEIDPRPFQVQLEQAEAQLQRDQALLANARIDLARYAALVKEDAIPRQQYDTQIATVKQDEANLKVDQASIDNAKLQLVYCRITAPISGRIGLRLVDPGNIVHATDTNGLMVITQMQPITVIFALPEDELLTVVSKLRAGETLQVDALSRDMSRRLDSGHLLAVDNLIDQNTGTGRLRGVFPNRGSNLFPNQFVNVRILVQVLRRQVIVPAVAVQHGPQGTFVWVVNAEGTAEVRPVSPGVTEGIRTSVAKGLNAGDIVVTDGFGNLQPGRKVAIRPAIPPPPAGTMGPESGSRTEPLK
jgi:multidrug efflux system membrane fusion protein